MCGRAVDEADAQVHVNACLAGSVPRPAKLPRVNYALWTETRLRAELRALGLRTAGDKAMLQRRHAEWINLWNANTDAKHPLTRTDLIRRLERWERTARTLQPSIREVARDSWLRTHRDAFAQLASSARQSIKDTCVSSSSDCKHTERETEQSTENTKTEPNI